VLHENQLSGTVPSAVLSLPNLKVLQLQNNKLGVDLVLRKSENISEYALFDAGYKPVRFKIDDIQKINIERQTRMADTKFEDVD